MLKSLITSFIEKKIPGFTQTIGDFSKNKSNSVGMVITLFGIQILTGDITNIIGHAYVLFGAAIFVIRDAIAKIQK